MAKLGSHAFNTSPSMATCLDNHRIPHFIFVVVLMMDKLLMALTYHLRGTFNVKLCPYGLDVLSYSIKTIK